MSEIPTAQRNKEYLLLSEYQNKYADKPCAMYRLLYLYKADREAIWITLLSYSLNYFNIKNLTLTDVYVRDILFIVWRYGPFNENGLYSSESNREFDLHLQQDGCGGIRDINELSEWGKGLHLIEKIPMPANNFLLVWRSY